MTPKQYRKAIEAIGLNQVQAGTFFGVTGRTSRVYASRGAPQIVAMLLRLMIDRKISVDEVNEVMKRKETR